MTNKDLADVIFPNITKTIEDYEKEYGVKVYRFEVIDVTTGSVVANTHIGSLVSSGKTSTSRGRGSPYFGGAQRTLCKRRSD